MTKKYIEKHTHEDENGNTVEHITTSNEASTTETVLARISQVVLSVGAFISGLVLLRFVMQLLDANASNSFVNLVYSITNPIISPFENMFSINTAAESTGGEFEIASVVAIILISFVAWMIARFMQDSASDV